MALELFETGNKRAWAIWRISESEAELMSLMKHREEAPDTISHPNKRLEWLAGRLLTQTLLDNFELPFYGMVKDEHGKPFLRRVNAHISLSHSYPFVAVIIDREMVVGIDLEQPKEKLLRVGPRVLSETELEDAGSDIVKHCVYWCAKEAMIKIHGMKDLAMASQLLVEPFEIEKESNIIGRIIVNESERVIPLCYRVYSQFVVAFNRERTSDLKFNQ